jgi:aspartate racemase
MRVIGLIGGMSWESTAAYYRVINLDMKARLGGHHSAKIVLYSVDFAEVERLQQLNRWDEAGLLLANAALAVERAGADFILLCTNTMHEVAAAIEQAVRIPLLHIADPTAAALKSSGIESVGLLGTRFTMEREFYIDRLRKQGRSVVVPELADRNSVHRIIYEELVHGAVNEDSRVELLAIVDRLRAQGAQGVILGCTELSMLIESRSTPIPCFDTTALHAQAAVEAALR